MLPLPALMVQSARLRMSLHPCGGGVRVCIHECVFNCECTRSGTYPIVCCTACSGQVRWVANVALQAWGAEADDKARGCATPQRLVSRVKF